MLSPNRNDDLNVVFNSMVSCAAWFWWSEVGGTALSCSLTAPPVGQRVKLKGQRWQSERWRGRGFYSNILPELLPPPHPPLWARWEGGRARRMPFSMKGRSSVAMVTEGRKMGDRKRGRGRCSMRIGGQRKQNEEDGGWLKNDKITVTAIQSSYEWANLTEKCQNRVRLFQSWPFSETVLL